MARKSGGYTRCRLFRGVGANFHFFRLFTPPLCSMLCKKRHGGTTSSLVHFRWISSFIGLPFHPQIFSVSLVPSLPFPSFFPPRSSSSPSLSLSLSLSLPPSLSLFSFHSRIDPLSLSLLLSSGLTLLPLASLISRRSPPTTLDTSGHGRSPYVTDTIPLE